MINKIGIVSMAVLTLIMLAVPAFAITAYIRPPKMTFTENISSFPFSINSSIEVSNQNDIPVNVSMSYSILNVSMQDSNFTLQVNETKNVTFLIFINESGNYSGGVIATYSRYFLSNICFSSIVGDNATINETKICNTYFQQLAVQSDITIYAFKDNTNNTTNDTILIPSVAPSNFLSSSSSGGGGGSSLISPFSLNTSKNTSSNATANITANVIMLNITTGNASWIVNITNETSNEPSKPLIFRFGGLITIAGILIIVALIAYILTRKKKVKGK